MHETDAAVAHRSSTYAGTAYGRTMSWHASASTAFTNLVHCPLECEQYALCHVDVLHRVLNNCLCRICMTQLSDADALP